MKKVTWIDFNNSKAFVTLEDAQDWIAKNENKYLPKGKEIESTFTWSIGKKHYASGMWVKDKEEE